MRKAFIGDIHGAADELEKLYKMLQNYSLDAIEHCGDLIDRGPDPGGVIQFCRENAIGGILGNHESVILQYPTAQGNLPKNPDKLRSYLALTADPKNLEYVRSLPYWKMHGNLLHVHAGISAHQPLTDQGILYCTASMVHPDFPGKTKWMNMTREGIPEETLRSQGWRRWYEVYNLEHDVVVGHRSIEKTAGEAEVYQCAHGPKIFFVDTGAWFHKNLTAVIYPDKIFVSTKMGEYKLKP
jgi:hypothetical protein